MPDDTTPSRAARAAAPVVPVAIVAILLLTMIGLSIWYLTRREPLVVQGEVQTRTFDMAARVDGRVAKIDVDRSQNVKQGASLIRIENPELIAKLAQSRADLAVAQAELARVKAGFRAETIAVRKAETERAEADLTLAQQTYDRKRTLVATHDAPVADLDRATAALAVAQRGLEQAQFAYKEAVSGYTREDLGIAQSKVEAAQAGVETLKSLVDQLVVVAPADSQVFRIPIEDGEFVLPGIPLITLIDLSDMWVQFDVREDLLRDIKVGTRIHVHVPALHDRVVDLEVRVIGAKGEYTGWRATRSTGDFDLRTFEIRAYPTQPVDGLRPGMSVYTDWSDLSHVIGMEPGLLAVIRREVRWIRRDPAMRFLLFGVPAIAFVLLGLTFSASVVRGLGVTVVDMDHSATSRLFVQTLDASPGIAIVRRGNNLGAASLAIRAGDSIAAIYLPPDFERDLTAGRRPHAVGFYNTQYFTPGNNASKSISDAINTATAAVAPATAGTPHAGDAGLVPEEYVLTNPALNYAAFLLRAVLPTVLHVVIAISAAYAVGSEFRRRGMSAWWEASGHSISAALVGKLLPYFIVQLAMFALMVAILDLWLGVGFRGDVLLMTVAAMLLIVAYQMIGCLLQLLTRNLALGLSLTGIIVSPAFGYAGVGFPVIAMGWFPRAWGAILPLRWYIQILFDQAERGAPLRQTAEPFACLCAIIAILMALVWLRCRALARTGFAAASDQETPDRPGSGIGGAFLAEWRRVLGDRGVLGLFILAPMLYAVFYPQPYLGQLVRNIPIAVVDQDNTDLSHGLIQALGAHGNLSIALRATTFAEAEDAIQARRAFGIVGIPPDTERNVLKGVSARLPIYGDSTYFILFNRTLQGILELVQAVVIDAVTASARRSGAGVRAATAATAPVDLVMVPLFNPTASYSAYVVPAAFVLILHQTLLMGAAMLGGVAYEAGGPAERRTRASAASILGQGLAHWAIYVPAMLLYFVIMPRVYGFSTLGGFWQIVTLSFPFILATSFLGQTLGLVFRHRETAVLLVLATSLPQFFLVGAAWPAEAIPSFLRSARELLPSVSAIDGFVRINQMGASLFEVRGRWEALWALTLLYFLTAAALAYLRPLRSPPHAPAG